MAIFAVNTGCREREVTGLMWHEVVPVPELSTHVVVLPASRTKNKRPRVVVLNRIVESIIAANRGRHKEFVFPFRGHPVDRMNNTAWRRARKVAGLQQVRVHDLRHTFGRRLRAAGVSLEDRQDLLGHESGRITTEYSAAEIGHLVECVNRIAEEGRDTTFLRAVSRKTHATVGA